MGEYNRLLHTGAPILEINYMPLPLCATGTARLKTVESH